MRPSPHSTTVYFLTFHFTSLHFADPPLPFNFALFITFLTLSLGRAIAQAVSRRLPTAAARVQTRVC
jgi:hypothetical protein